MLRHHGNVYIHTRSDPPPRQLDVIASCFVFLVHLGRPEGFDRNLGVYRAGKNVEQLQVIVTIL